MTNLAGLFATLLLALLGGAAASLTAVPAAWFTGAMVAVSVAAVSGLRLHMPRRLIDAAMVMIGMLLGAGVTPEVVAGIARWPVSLALLCVSIVAVQVGVQNFLMRVGGWDRNTAFFAALPGAMMYALAGAAETGADLRKVAINQLVRLFLLIAILPTIVTLIDPVEAPAARIVLSFDEMLMVFAAGLGGAVLFRFLRVPVALMTGSLAGSALLHGTGVVLGSFPNPLIVAAFVILGASVGVRFVGTTLRYLAENAIPTFGAFLLAVGVSGTLAYAVTLIVDLPLDQLVIAFMPGGVDAMTAVALAMHMDSAFVAAHQVLRLMSVMLLGPFAARLALGRPSKTPQET